MACKITVSRVCKGNIAKLGYVFVIINFIHNRKKYTAYEEVKSGLTALHGEIAARMFAKMQHKYGLYPAPEVIKRSWFGRLLYKIGRLFKK